MAKQTWNNPIDKNIDWGGDDNTGGLPVSGEMVQKFIKESLESKAGIFHYDTANNRYLVFSDSENRDLYIADPTRTDLIIGSFDAPFNYSAEIFLTSKSYNAIALGATGNYIDFTFDVKNKQGASTGENIVVTYTIIRNATKQVIKENKKHGDAVHFNVDKYLGEGTNTVIVGIQGQSTLAATTVAITYQVVNLTIQDVIDISRVYNITKGDSTLEIPFTVSGYGTKTVEWYIDGELVEFDKSTDEVVDVTTTRTKYINVANLQQGNHHLEVRAFTIVNGENFYTDTLYRDFFIYTGANSDLMLGVALTIPAGEPVVGANNVSIPNMIQYVPYTVRLASYSPLNTLNTEVTIRLDDEVVGTINTNNSQEYTFEVIPSTEGDKVLYIETATTQYAIPVIVAPSLISIEEITNNLALDFNGRGKNNSSIDKDYWVQGDYIATFEGFEWNDKSGWLDGRLEMNAGTSLGINYAPLSGKPTNTGKTIEIEWSTKNVVNDDAIICDLRGDNGAGILITATKVSLTSVNGVTIETEYKSDENVRIAFVINKASNATNQHLSFIYCNGKISRGETWAATDSYTSDREILFTSTSDAEISLKAIRIYDIALSSDEILNNYILYRDSIDEMLNVYERNDVYEDGTTTFSPDKMMSRLPVMIVTGDIPTLEETSDKNTQIVVDVDYYNMQDPSKSFRMVNAAMRPQGTSSMGYPKKNFRIYTRELEGTTLYDSNGKVVSDKLYSFKDGAQPVDCWCLKADYAESSGAHNTGIARLWNKALYDARVTVDLGEGNPHNIDRAAVLRTNAQTKALEANYPYDVRTTIDGFPILMFYRRNENDSPIFIGKYNFNNDKSTESVFGFTGIPNFDNSRMQCWEILNNGNSLALFTEADSFDTGWKDAFESRYPDTKTPNTSDLKAFCQWMSTVTPEAFVTEKWNHIDVYKVAAYWVYLMRHAGADQFVKNAMLTSEDGEKFYYILYDNDTINGLINTGDIRIKPTDGRQTVDASGSYVFAGHDSRMWNLLEADAEFNEIVAAVDNALYSAGISYINTIKVFDEDQSNKWVERVYNQDAEYKYIGPYREEGTNNLFMMQGSRNLHRRWWLSKRFSIFDAKYVSGTYKSDAVEIKCLNGTEAGQQFTITAGYPLDYGYGINNKPREKGVTLNIGDSYTFTTQEVVNVGDPIRIYGAPNISELDLSPMTSRLATLTVTNANSDTLGTKMKKLVVGNPSVENMELKEISGLKKLTSLEYLDIQGLKNITSLDLTSQPQLKELKAFGSNIASVSFAKGAPIEKLELPTSVTSLDLNHLTRLTTENLLFESGMNGISSISIKGCPKLSKDFAWVYNWYANKTTPNETSSLVMDNVDWKDVNAEQLAELTNLGNISLKGKVTVTDINLDQLNMLMDAFGESAFDKNAELFINAPDAIFVTGRTELLEGESEDYACIVFGADVESLTWSIYSGGSSSYTSIDAKTGLLTTKEGAGTRTLTIRVVAKTSNGAMSLNTSVSVKARTYPASDTTILSGNSRLDNTTEVYKLEVSTPNVNGEYIVSWSLVGLEEYAEIETSNKTQCVIKKIQDVATAVSGTLTCTLTKKNNNASIFAKEMTIEIVNEAVAETDIGIVTALYNKGLCANSTYITKEEAALISDNDLQPGTSSSTGVFYSQRTAIKRFDGFQYFTGITKVPKYLFYEMPNLESVKLPFGVTTIEKQAFTRAAKSVVTNVYLSSSVSTIEAESVRFYSYSSPFRLIAPEDSLFFKTYEEGLYTKDGALVLCFSAEKEYNAPSWLTAINALAFRTVKMETVRINVPNVSIKPTSLFMDIGISGVGLSVYTDSDLKLSAFRQSDSAASSVNMNLNVLHFGKDITSATLDLFPYLAGTHLHPNLVSCDPENPIILIEGYGVYSKDGATLLHIMKTATGDFVARLGTKEVGKWAAGQSGISSFTLLEGATTIGESPFSSCNNLKEVTLPATMTTVGYNGFRYCDALETINIKALVPPSYSSSLSSSGDKAEKKEIIVPSSSLDAYKNSSWGKTSYEVKGSYLPNECVSLVITADDVNGRMKTTEVQYTALTNGVDFFTEERVEGIEVVGTGVSSEFPQNTSYTDTIEREVSFTYLGVTATTTITQGVWVDSGYFVELNSQWQESATIANPDSATYDGVYESFSNKGQGNTAAIMYIDIIGYETFKFYVRSYAESSFDYVVVSNLDATLVNGTTSGSAVKMTTNGKQTSGTAISAYQLVEFTEIDGGDHRISVMFRKDSSGNSGTDQGYVLIPKEQDW